MMLTPPLRSTQAFLARHRVEARMSAVGRTLGPQQSDRILQDVEAQ
jgi:hypothetical protein